MEKNIEKAVEIIKIESANKIREIIDSKENNTYKLLHIEAICKSAWEQEKRLVSPSQLN